MKKVRGPVHIQDTRFQRVWQKTILVNDTLYYKYTLYLFTIAVTTGETLNYCLKTL